jgi:hypothetical protein
MKRRQIKIKFQNGLGFDVVSLILADLSAEFEFINSNDPDFIVFGPYGNDIPLKGNYQRIAYYCECITPDMNICDWAFGVPREEEINHPKYQRIQWHGLQPQSLVKHINVEEVFHQKTKFCNFLYSNHIPYREAFFKQLSKYKKVDAPGKSMNNMRPIDEQYKSDTWTNKRNFLSPYKFTVAFESYVYPGYQTEKLYDAMQMNSIPIYCGDPMIGEIFNTNSFINLQEHITVRNPQVKDFLEKSGQYTFADYRPGSYTSLQYRVRRKFKTAAKAWKMRMQTNNFNFGPLIEKIIELDNNPILYKAMLGEPWLKGNSVPPSPAAARWREIFNTTRN